MMDALRASLSSHGAILNRHGGLSRNGASLALGPVYQAQRRAKYLAAQIAALFGSGLNGSWSEPNSAITTPWYQDSAGASPVVAVGQQIGKAIDKSGNGNNEVQVTAPARPILLKDGGGHYKSFDGVDDFFSCPTGGGGSAGFFWCGAISFAGLSGAARTIFSDASANGGYILQINSASRVILAAGNGSIYTSASNPLVPIVGKKYLLTAWDDGINLNVQFDESAVATAPRPVVVAGSSGFFECRGAGGGQFFFGGIHARVYIKDYGLTEAQRATVKDYIKQQAVL